MKYVFKNPNQSLEVRGIGIVHPGNLTEALYKKVMAVSTSFGNYFTVQEEKQTVKTTPKTTKSNDKSNSNT